MPKSRARSFGKRASTGVASRAKREVLHTIGGQLALSAADPLSGYDASVISRRFRQSAPHRLVDCPPLQPKVREKSLRRASSGGAEAMLERPLWPGRKEPLLFLSVERRVMGRSRDQVVAEEVRGRSSLGVVCRPSYVRIGDPALRDPRRKTPDRRNTRAATSSARFDLAGARSRSSSRQMHHAAAAIALQLDAGHRCQAAEAPKGGWRWRPTRLQAREKPSGDDRVRLDAT